MRKASIWLSMALASCAPHELIRPLKPLEIALAPYQDVVTAALPGTLMYENDCLMFRDEATKAYLMPIWPEGARSTALRSCSTNPERRTSTCS